MSRLTPTNPDEGLPPGQPQGRPPRPPQTRVKAWRLFEMQRLLRDRPRTVRELAHYFEVDRRSIQRDLQAMIEDGQGVERRGHSYLLPSAAGPLGAVEALALHMAARLLYRHAPANNRHYREGALRLAALLPEPARSAALRSVEGQAQRYDESQTLELVAQAWFEGRILRFDHRPPGPSEPERGLEVQVLFVEVSRTSLAPFVIGHERTRSRAVRAFRLSRMHHATVLPDSVPLAALDAFDPRDHLSDTWGEVGCGQTGRVSISLRFAPEAAYRVLEGACPDLTDVAIHDDGSLTARLEAGVDDSGQPRGVLPWLLSWGPQVEVLDPDTLRASWLGALRETLARYGGSN